MSLQSAQSREEVVSRERSPRAAPKGELCVYVGCQGIQVAIPVRRVERLMLYDEVAEPLGRELSGRTLVPAASPRGDGSAVIQVAGRWYSRWELGAMLEQPVRPRSWVLLRVPHAGYDVPIALCAGGCRIVQPLRATVPLPPGMFRARRAALWAAFLTFRREEDDGPVGLCLDPLRFWTPEELSRAQATLLAARARGEGG